MTREVKVGALVLTAAVVLAAGVFLIGERNNLFARKNHYYVRFENVAGLAPGSPVQLNGVTVGNVDRVVLPERVDESLLTVWISMEHKYGGRVRSDSLARIKTLGLLGDKYIEISSGSADAEIVPVEGQIQAAPATDVDHLLASGEDAVDNVVAISYSLRSILGRLEQGQGFLGELLSESETGDQVKGSLVQTAANLERITSRIEGGQGTLGALLRDDRLARRLESATAHLDQILTQVDSGGGTLGALLSDEKLLEDFKSAVSGLRETAASLQGFVDDLQTQEGLLQKFLHDEDYAREVSEDLRRLVENLSLVSDKIERGEGSLGEIINDPHLYQALDDILVGIDESKLLRWLIRNRQKAGIQKRYRDEVESAD